MADPRALAKGLIESRNPFDWSGVGEAMPENIGRNKVVDPLASALMSAATLPKRAMDSAQRFTETGEYNPGPILEAAMLPMGTGAIAGVPLRAGEAALGAGIRTYRNVPESLMGFKKSGPQSAFDQTAYPHTQQVEVTLPATSYGPRDTFRDEIKGMNADHALERAWRNWPIAMHITPVK
jgi:hypothetical protein